MIYKVFEKVYNASLLNLILLGFFIRLLFLGYTSWTGDIVVFHQALLNYLGGLDIYAPTPATFTYPILWFFTFSPLLLLLSWIFGPAIFATYVKEITGVFISTQMVSQTVTSPLFNFALKLPLALGDLALGLLIYDIVKSLRNEKSARIAFLIWFFNPLVLIISSWQGQYEVLPALMTVLSFWLLSKQKYFSSGLALSFGILYKIYPIYLLPLYLLAVFEKKQKINQFVFGLLLPLVLILPIFLKTNIKGAVFTRLETFKMEGGLNLWAFSYLPFLKNFASNYAFLFYKIFFWLGVLSAFLIPLYLFLKRGLNFQKKFLFGHLMILTFLTLTLPRTNAHYILWFLPFLVLVLALYDKFRFQFHIIWLSSLGFLFGLFSFAYKVFFYPLGIYTPLVSLDSINQQVLSFRQIRGLLNPLLFYDFMLIFGIATAISALSCFIKSFKEVEQ